jgi:hypothetical protein
MRINVGCGQTPTPGWTNFDNSLTVRISRWPSLVWLMSKARLLTANQANFARTARLSDIRFAEATKLPLPDHSVEVAYSSHMIELLDPSDLSTFLAECMRVLLPGGIIRLTSADLERARSLGFIERLRLEVVEERVESGDSEEVVTRTALARPRPAGLRGRIRELIVGDRAERLWYYDRVSEVRMLGRAGFVEASVLAPGQTMISDSGMLNLEERSHESFYVEAYAPKS